MPYQPLVIANYLIEKSLASGELMTPMKLLKLVYIAHGWHLALTQEPLITEGVQAWKYGPVVPSVYHWFKDFGSSPITEMCSFAGSGAAIDSETRAIVDRVWDVYRQFDGGQLSSMTHKSGTPWDITVRQFGGKLPDHLIIPNDLIRKHYSELSASRDPRSNPARATAAS